MKLNQKSVVLKTVGVLLTLMLGVSACATMEGAGKDIETAGEAVQDAAQD